MLEHLHIVGFQAHNELSLELGQISCLVGPSDSGKSSVLRALRWLATNRPTGDSFIHKGSKVASTCLQIDGHTITRTRGNGVNALQLDGETYPTLGTGPIPQTISDLLNLSESAFALQHDSPYLFGRTAGEVSRDLNNVVNLTLIDSTLANAASAVRKAKTEADVAERRLQEARQRRDTLTWVAEADKAMQALEQSYTALETNRLQQAKIAVTLQKATKCQEAIVNATNARLATEKAIAAATKALQASNKANRAVDLVERLRKAEESKHFASIASDWTRVEKTVAVAQRSQQKVGKAMTTLQRLQSALAQKKKATMEATKASKAWQNEMGEVCPLCEQPISKGD